MYHIFEIYVQKENATINNLHLTKYFPNDLHCRISPSTANFLYLTDFIFCSHPYYYNFATKKIMNMIAYRNCFNIQYSKQKI